MNDADDSPMESAVRVMPNLKTKIAAAAAEPRLKTHLPMAPTLTG
jgi:hypothetical protein